MRPFVEAVIQRLVDRTHTDADLDYVAEYMLKQIRHHRETYARRKELYERIEGPKTIDFINNDLYIKRRYKLTLYIAKDLIVLESDGRFLATFHDNIRYTVRNNAESELSRLNEQHLDRFSRMFLSSGRKYVDPEDLENVYERLKEYRNPITKDYAKNSLFFWDIRFI